MVIRIIGNTNRQHRLFSDASDGVGVLIHDVSEITAAVHLAAEDDAAGASGIFMIQNDRAGVKVRQRAGRLRDVQPSRRSGRSDAEITFFQPHFFRGPLIPFVHGIRGHRLPKGAAVNAHTVGHGGGAARPKHETLALPAVIPHRRRAGLGVVDADDTQDIKVGRGVIFVDSDEAAHGIQEQFLRAGSLPVGLEEARSVALIIDADPQTLFRLGGVRDQKLRRGGGGGARVRAGDGEARGGLVGAHADVAAVHHRQRGAVCAEVLGILRPKRECRAHDLLAWRYFVIRRIRVIVDCHAQKAVTAAKRVGYGKNRRALIRLGVAESGAVRGHALADKHTEFPVGDRHRLGFGIDQIGDLGVGGMVPNTEGDLAVHRRARAHQVARGVQHAPLITDETRQAGSDSLRQGKSRQPERGGNDGQEKGWRFHSRKSQKCCSGMDYGLIVMTPSSEARRSSKVPVSRKPFPVPTPVESLCRPWMTSA